MRAATVVTGAGTPDRSNVIAAEPAEPVVATAAAQPVPAPGDAAPADPPASDAPASDGPRSDPPRFRLGNRPPLTGIRAPLILAVLVYHSNFRTLPGAWVTLQVFFVLSGFLITAMLASEGRRNGRISLARFYSRRAARLLPPLALVIVLMAVYAAFVSVADASQRLWGDSAAAIFYYADYRQALGDAPFFGYLAQTWSLSVEEQFYVIWSVLMVLAIATNRRRLAYWFAVAGIVASTADRLWIVFSAPRFDHAVFTRVYYAFDTRADAIFLGCLLGLLANDGYFSAWRPWASRLLSAGAVCSAAFLVWILFSAPLFHENLVVWWLPATTLASAVIILSLIISPLSIGARFIGLAPFVFVGDLSYMLYIVHFPVYLALQPGADGTHLPYLPTEILRLGVIFAIAVASWYLMEQPLMRWRRRSAAR